MLKGQALPVEAATAAGLAAGQATPPPRPAPKGPGLDQPVKPGAAVALRKESPPKPRSATPQEQLEEFAKDLRELRGQAGLGYPEMAELSHYTMKTLASAAGGLNLPTLPVTMAYVRACEGSVAEWEDRWHRLADALKSAEDEAGTDGTDGTDGAARGRAGPGDHADHEPTPDRRGDAEERHDPRDDGAPEERARPEQAERTRTRPSQVSTPPSAPSGTSAQEQEPPPPASDQVYVITSAAPRRPRR